MAVGYFSLVKLWPLVNRSTPTSLASAIRTIPALGRGTARQLEEAIFFFNFSRHSV